MDLTYTYPCCGETHEYSRKQSFFNAIKNNSKCNSCSKKGQIAWNKEEKPVEGWLYTYPCCNKIKKYGSKGHLKRAVENNVKCLSCATKGKNTWTKGRKLSPEHIEKRSKARIGKKLKPRTEKAKLNHRIASLKRMERLGINGCEDEGAREWFNNYNKENNSNYQPKTFMKWGYRADGYDEALHIWIEYDTKYHSYQYQNKKDIIRQNNIIEYFKLIGKPLNNFIRVLAYDNYKIIEYK